MAGFAYLIRHAKAGDRMDWDRPDEERPLSRAGDRQAQGIADLLAGEPLARVVSSPAVRCVQTVRPLAERLGLPLEEDDILMEGAGPAGAEALARSAIDGASVALCSHGDVILELLGDLDEGGVPLTAGTPAKKGSIWVLEVQDGRIVRGRYLPPPAGEG